MLPAGYSAGVGVGVGVEARLGVVVVHLTVLAAVATALFVAQNKGLAAYAVVYAGATLIAVLAGVPPLARQGWLPEAPLSYPAGAFLASAAAGALTVVRLQRLAERRVGRVR